MSLSINQMYNQFYQIRINSLTSKHQTQSNRVLLFTNKISDTAQRINFYEQQKVLTLATPSGEQIPIKAEYFDWYAGFNPGDPSTWGNDRVTYATPCQKEIYIYRKATQTEYDNTDEGERMDNNGQLYVRIPYEHTGDDLANSTSPYTSEVLAYGIQDSRVLSANLMSGEYTLAYTNDEGEMSAIHYSNLPFIAEKEDAKAYQEIIEILESERHNLQKTEKKLESERQTTEMEIQALSSMMESTEKVLQKNTESFKWG